ncbi:synaptonemal complex protein 2-like isoform X2 [Megalobrama amblycephala]|uniref:synaptonemal complex protein 2-like isoform X2 n=1 Tax=Megalobrama amblycephala TaxID=75352 RepID=UPI00201419F5|nr:synaptonemal complex protein 2-like isoform X2 [Megalobrama amblycephala]
MAPSQDHQVEKLVDEAFKHSNFQALEKFLQNESKEEISLKCSRQFMTKLDKLFNREMDLGNVDHACLVLTVLHKYGEMLVFPGGGGISVIVAHGFVKKIMQWFEKARKLWVEAGSSRNETLIKLAEDFFDALMVVHESCKEGTYEVTEALLSHIGKLSSDAQINIMIQKEAARKLNAILAKIPMELKKKKKILSSQEASCMMNDVASRILKGGDYDLQVSLMEALCRMTSPAQRNELADSWFNMTFVFSAFKKIKDSEFETDCRKFLNMVNGMQGDGRSVYSYPCLEAFLDKHELLMPEDENLEAFWIDFNLGSQSISFYFCVTDKDAQDGQWNTLCIAENEVHSYTVEEESGRKTLHLVLTEPVSIDHLEGSRVCIKFSSSLDILRATENVYGQAKNRTSVRKSSIAKTPVHVNLSSQESSQVFVPESQVSPSLRVEGRASSSVRQCIPGQSLTHQTPNIIPQQMVTPIQMKVSVGCQQGSSSSGFVLPSVSKLMVKPALQMMSSSERKKEIELRDLMMSKTSCNVSSLSFHRENNQKKAHVIQAQSTPAPQNEDQQKDHRVKAKAKKYRKNIPVDKVVEMVQADKEHEENTFDNSIVPDSQPVRKGSSFSPGLWSLNSSKRRISVSGSLLALQKDCSKNGSVSDGSFHPPPQRLSPAQCASSTLTQNQLHTQLTQRLEEVLREQQGTDGRAAQRAPQKRGSSLEPKTTAQEKEEVETSVRSMPARPTQQRRKSSKVQGDESDRENMAHASDSMVKMISSHYKRSAKAASPEPRPQVNTASTNRYLFNKSCHSSSTEKTAAKSSSLHKSKRPFQKLEDIYAFTEVTPKISVRKKSSDASRAESSATINSPTLSKSAGRPQPPKAATINAKKNLFSDTDTDNMTEISWLSSANRKPKPKVADYSRQPVKTTFPSADAAFKSPYTPLSSPKTVKEQIKPKRKRQKKVAEQKDKRQPSISNKKTTGRPQRAAALTKTYRETSDSDDQSSLSENEKAPPPKKKAVGRPAAFQQTIPARNTGQEQRREKTSVDVSRRQNEKNVLKNADKAFAKIQQDQRNDNGKKMSSLEHLTVKKTSSAQGSARRQKESWASRLSSTFASPPSIEKMRSHEKLTTNLRSNTTPLRSLSISPIEADSPPLEPLHPLKEIQASSLCKTSGNKGAVKPPSLSITPVSKTSRSCKQNPAAAQVELSPVHSLLTQTQPLIKEKCTLPSPPIYPDLQEEKRDNMNRTSPASFERRSVISVTMSQSSHISVSNMAMMCTELEKTPRTQGSKAERPEFKSGPTVIHKHVIPCQSAALSEGDEDSEEDKENKAPSPSQLALKMKPRKLFVPTDKYWTPSPNIKLLVKDQSSSEEEDEDIVAVNGRRKKSYQTGLNKRAKETTFSTEEVETLSSCTRSSCRHASVEADIDLTQPAQEVGFICHQFSSELKRKLKNRCRTMDLYTKQSLKTLQQHMSSVSVQVHQYSSQRMEKVKQVLLGEIEDLEQDDTVLRSMEEELMTYWEKQTLAFHTYREKGTKRLQHLKSTIQTDVCDCLEYEEQIFSLEVSMMKKNMKSVQERFFKEMQDEDLTSVRRGLQSLFFPDASRF